MVMCQVINAEGSVTWPSGFQVRDCQVRWRVVDGQKVQEHQDRGVSEDSNSSVKTVLGTKRVPSVLELLVASEKGEGARQTVAVGKADAVNVAAEAGVGIPNRFTEGGRGKNPVVKGLILPTILLSSI